MKKAIILLLFLAVAFDMSAQAPRRDTVVLSVYNNNQRFMLYPMPFGKDRPDKDFTAEMVVALDTVNVLQTSTKKDTSGKYSKQLFVQRKCGKLSTGVRDKVALIYMSKDCDVSTQIMLAQDSGAVAVIVIHTTDNRDSVALPKKSGKIKYDNDNKVKIPCFTVRKGIGAMLTQMLPSLVGIQRPKTDVGTIQALTTPSSTVDIAAQRAKKDSITQSALEKNTQANGFQGNSFQGEGWILSPNPASEEVVLQYNFESTAPVDISIFNAIGQVVTTYKLTDTQTGKLNIDISAWQNGIYEMSLQSGNLKQTKQFVVLH